MFGASGFHVVSVHSIALLLAMTELLEAFKKDRRALPRAMDRDDLICQRTEGKIPFLRRRPHQVACFGGQ